MSPLSFISASSSNGEANAIILNAISELGEGLFIIEGKRIIYANDACASISGYTAEELCALPSFLSLATKDQYPKLLERLQKRIMGKPVSDHYRTTFLHKLGHQVHIEVAVKVLRITTKPQFLVLARDVTREEETGRINQEMQQREQELLAQAEIERNRLLNLFQQAPASIIMYKGPTHIFEFVNPLGKKVLGHRELEGIAIKEAFPELESQQISEVANHVYKTGETFYGNEFKVSLDWGHTGTVSDRYWNMVVQAYYTHGQIAGVMSFAFEVTEQVISRKQVEASAKELREMQNRLMLAQRAANIGTFEWDFKTDVIVWTEELEKLYGLNPGEFTGTREHWRSFTHPDDIEILAQANKLAIAEASEINVDFRIILPNQAHKWVNLRADIYADEHGKPERMIGIVMDITEKKKTEELITYQASHDPLTGLSNRKGLDEQFRIGRNAATRNRKIMAVLFIDLDRFKNINDTLGHSVGDEILKEAAKRFKSVVRNIDTIARLGGDEFIILLCDMYSPKDVTRIAQKLLKTLEEPFVVDKNTLHITTSIGIALFPQDGEDIFTLFKHSDIALYRAKEKGRNRFQYYDYAMNLQSHAKLSLENDLRYAVSRNELVLHYQPIVNKDLDVVGVEVLMRWIHPRLGLLSPQEIIPLAEETGLIVPMGQWIVETALQQHKQWLRMKLLDCKISINFSSRQFAEYDMVTKLQSTLEHLQFDPKYLELEITESIAMESADRTRNKFIDLREMNIDLSIDDFGTGYSSLSYLKNFPVSRLKIDKSFVRYSTTDQSDAAIIRAVTTMAANLQFSVVAEGVETKEQFDLLCDVGVDSFQGYYFSRPIPADKFAQWLATHKANKTLP